MSSAFHGSGWSCPVRAQDGRIAAVGGDDAIGQSIWIILATARGERVMRPDFGCGIHDLVFAAVSAATAGRVATEVREALIAWEPRIDLVDVHVTDHEDDPRIMLIEVEYRVRSTNTAHNLVYPFYLE